MTEEEWLTQTDPVPLFARLFAGMSERKARLLRVAVARAIWDEFTHPVLRAAVEAAERYVDDACDVAEASECIRQLYDLPVRPPDGPRPPLLHRCLAINSLAGLRVLLGQSDGSGGPVGDGGANWLAVMQHHPATVTPLLRDLFGNPSPAAPFDPSWLTETVTALARGIYHDRAFDRLPILADALEEAGCDRLEVLGHCRGDGPHARGCWVVDSVLGKE